MVQAVSSTERPAPARTSSSTAVFGLSDLTRLDLVDEYQLVVPPVALGEGRPLFRNLPDRRKSRSCKWWS